MHKLWTDEEIEKLTNAYNNGMKIADIQKQIFPYYSFSQVSSKISVLHLKHKNPRGWSDEDLRILKEVFPYYENKEIAEKFLPTKTFRGVGSMARKLGLNKESVSWTSEEDNILRENYNKIKIEEIIPLLHKKTRTAILSRASELDIKNTPYDEWSDAEINILKQYYTKIGSDEIVARNLLPGRKALGIRDKANKLGLYRRTPVKEWTKDEIQLLTKYYPTYSNDYILENILPNRKLNQVNKKAKELGLKKLGNPRNGSIFWTDERIQLLYDEYPHMPTQEFYDKYFNGITSLSNVYGKVVELGIKKEWATPYAVWTNEEIEMVKNDFSNWTVSLDELAERCHKTRPQLEEYGYHTLGLKRSYPKIFTPEEDEIIKELYPNNKSSDIIRHFPGRTVDQLDRYARRMGVKKTKNYIREVTLNGTKNSLVKSTPQQTIDDLLDKMGINYDSEFECEYYLIDEYLRDYNLMIEVQGDFWHGSPELKDRKPNTRGMKSNIKKDKSKHTYIKNTYGIEILYLWEKDVNENIKLCEDLIDLYINKNGVLNNYHSFNYEYDNEGKLIVNEKYQIGY